MNLYEFQQEDAYRFADFLRADTKTKGDQLHFSYCPYCHGGKSRDKGSFAIDLKTGKFKCLRSSCSAKGNMITLARDFSFSLSEDVDRYYAQGDYTRDKFKKFREMHIASTEPAFDYMKSRGIDREICEKYFITTHKDNDKVLVFPFFDERKTLKFIKYRKTDFIKGKDKSKEWCESNCQPILFGMFQCNPENKTLVITEGQIDSLSVTQSGIENAVSVPTGCNGFTWIPYCWEWMHQFEKIIVFGDYERGKISLLDTIAKRFKSIAVYHVRPEDYKDCKDANELLQKYGAGYINYCITNAMPVPMERVIPISQVEDVDLNKIEKLHTGINDLDKLLYGGLPFGQLHIIAGKRGDGKSTFAEQIVNYAIDQGYKTFSYSGELTCANYKTWMNFQVAGPRNIVENVSVEGSTYWIITNSTKDLINRWYADKCYIYDSESVDSDEREDLIKTIEEVICRYGVRVILVDNLMTALDLDAESGSDKYEKQSLFVKKLTRIALKYNALILLVAHSRKNKFTDDANDEVSGSADITNLAGVVLSYSRDKDAKTEFDRKLIVSKNRLYGRLNFNGIPLHFHEQSKRIYGDSDNVDYAFSWEEQSDGFVPVDNNANIPF